MKNKITQEKDITIEKIPVHIIKKTNMKNMYARVEEPKGDVVVSAPAWVNDETIKEFICENLLQIKQNRDKMLENYGGSLEYVSGENHYLWGLPYKLVVIEGEQYANVAVKKMMNGEVSLVMYISPRASIGNRRDILIRFYKSQISLELIKLIDECEKITGVHANEYKLRDMKTKWGSCNIQAKRICINIQLAKLPKDCLKYVLIHELTHLLEKSHNRTFHSLLHSFFPDWQETEEVLKHFCFE